MKILLVGFDSAWTATNRGALVAVLYSGTGEFQELNQPEVVDYVQAQGLVLGWQREHTPAATLILLDQPTIVENPTGQRPVENIVSSSVSLRYGGMQPANTGRREMFGVEAPMWRFLTQFGGPADPLQPIESTAVFETYPVLTIISLGWTLPDLRASGRLPKYNPQRRKTFSLSDWKWLCSAMSPLFRQRGMKGLANWIDEASQKTAPRKSDQDRLDACLCLIAAVDLVEQKQCLMLGDRRTGYIVVPYHKKLQTELEARCCKTSRVPTDWVREFRLQVGQAAMASAER